MNVDLECDKPVNAAVDDGLCSSFPVHPGGFYPDFYPASPVNGSIISSNKKYWQQISSPPNLVSHMLSRTVLRNSKKYFLQSLTRNVSHADKSPIPR